MQFSLIITRFLKVLSIVGLSFNISMASDTLSEEISNNKKSLFSDKYQTTGVTKDFTLGPYILAKRSNTVFLKFKLKETANIEVSVTKKAKSIITNEHLSKNILQNVNLGTFNCGEKFSYSIEDKNQNKIIFQKSLKSYPCEKENELSFAFISDTQQHQSEHDKMSKMLVQRARANDSSFIINAGDLVHYGGDEYRWERFISASKAYSTTIPMVPVIGNHGYRGTKEKDKLPILFQKYMIGHSNFKKGYYALDFNQVKLIVLNTNFNKFSKFQIYSQREWLKEQLEDCKKKSKSAIVTFHQSPITSNFFYYESISRKLRKNWLPLLERSGIVKLVLNGHSHLYERSYRNGIMYVVAGPFGGKVNYIPHMTNKYREIIIPHQYTFSFFKVRNDRIEMSTYDGYNKEIDSFTLDL